MLRKLTCFLLVMVLIAGCGGPGVPERTNIPETASQLRQAARELIPAGSELLRPGCTEPGVQPPPAVQAVDLDGDGDRELVVAYRVPGEPTQAGVVIATPEKETYRTVWQQELGYELADLRCLDVTGDGVPDVVVGGAIGASAGNSLKVLHFSPNDKGLPTVRVVWENGYHRMDIGDFDRDGRREIALWSKDTGSACAVVVYRAHPDLSGFHPVESAYAAYFPRVVAYYEAEVKRMPESRVLWYYLADAQVKAGQAEKALQSAAKGRQMQGEYPPWGNFNLVEGRALLALGRYGEALKKFAAVTAQEKQILPPPQKDRNSSIGSMLNMPVGEFDLADAYVGLGQAYEALGQYAEAEKAYRRPREFLPPDSVPVGERELRRLAARPAVNAVIKYLAALQPEDRDRGIKDIENWARNHGLAVHAVEPEWDRFSGTPRALIPQVLLLDVGKSSPPDGYDAHLICWWQFDRASKQEHFYWQTFFSADEIEHGLSRDHGLLKARLVVNSVHGAPEMGVFFDTAAWGSGSPIPTYYLYRLEGQQWQVVWRAPAAGNLWRGFHGTAEFTGPGLDSFNISGELWTEDGKGNIFHEANPGPHRRFSDTWQRKGDVYRRTRATVMPSSYNTLVEFIWCLSTDNINRATRLVTSSRLVQKAREAKMTQSPLGQSWGVGFNDDTQLLKGPLTITSGPAAGTTITFKKVGDQWLIDSIDKPGEH
ncbi:tetratricopeptide repeat protein [Syntrophothermus lipocalidus]|uniref:Tetratricopeptide TPR_2 repeat protein n=1 Tax=Syntrophothermus lipocalidus (strain DSM 12680 / TGB-C1) TaxID=643648 RepID=D7CMY2_SYNLT|nr:hypothetical protein [Syntrophothermus lipocalidus]ADI02067.1 Tetratricopeptide TPR_2 repeat protein [Syntrophothermus lipocalidus DSM 12680]